MFLPRVIRNKGFREPEMDRKKPLSEETPDEPPTKRPRIENVQSNANIPHFPENTTTAIDEAQKSPITPHDAKPEGTVKPQNDVKPRGPRFTVAPITDEYLEKLVCGIELIFSDYAHHDLESSKWLQSHYRTVNGEEKYIHLSAFLSHTNITTLKPPATQPLLARALTSFPSEYLQTHSAYNTITHVRRNPTTYPLPFIPTDTDNDITAPTSPFWTQRTIYIEPHQRGLCNIPAAIAYHIKKHGNMRKKWLPIQSVQRLPLGRGACAFVTLSGVVEVPDMWKKWIKEQRLEDWIVMTRAEHGRREAEYLELLMREKREGRGEEVGRLDKPVGEGGVEEPGSMEKEQDEEKEKAMEMVSVAKKKSRKRQKKKKKDEKGDAAEDKAEN